MSIPHIRFESSPDYAQALKRAAAACGVEGEYWDIWGRRHETSVETCRAILESMGVQCGSREAIDAELEERLWREWSRLSPPALVLAAEHRPHCVPVHVPLESGAREALVRIRLENGASEEFRLWLESLPVAATAELRGRRLARYQAPLPDRLPLGYHDLTVAAPLGGETLQSETRLIVCPDQAWVPPDLAAGGKAAGIAISLYGLRSARNWGCGDFTDLTKVIDWVAEDLGGSFISLNPLHAIANRQPFNTSPYLPASVFFRNPIYIDVEAVEEFACSQRARALFESPETQAELRALREAPFVEYERVYSLKLRLLQVAFESFLERRQAGSARAAAFEEHCRQEGALLENYATYCALDEWIHARRPDVWTWPDWPEEYRDPDSPAVREFREANRERILFHKYLQWLAETQLAEAQQHARRKGLGIGLYHDLALATDRCGFDLWAFRSFYASRCRVGAPPDDFAPKGQDWGFPPPNAERHREDGYRVFADTIRRNCRSGGALRIDHVMRLFRLFWIPDGMEAADGAYVRENHEDLLRIVALESVRQKALIVGEDLGTVEPSFREALARYGILSYRLFYFERNSDGEFRAPEEYPRQALVSATTHDLPTLAGYWIARDIDARREAGLLAGEDAWRARREAEKQKILDVLHRAGLLPDWFPRNAAEVPELSGELHNAITGFLASTPSMLMVLNQEDLLKETEQQNLPGSTWQYPNWRRKTRFTVEELRTAGQAQDFTRMFRHWLEKTGRQ